MQPVRLSLLSVSLLLAGVAGDLAAHGQALPTAAKAAEISAFGGYSPSYVDFGARTYTGFTGGADFTLFPRWHFDPSVEVRYTYAHGTIANEHTFLVGPRLQKDLLGNRVHPYVDFLFGQGTIDYHPAPSGHTSNWGPALSYGGGADFDVVRHLSLKLDFQQQSWNLGKSSYFKPQGGDYTLTPRTYTVGVTYHFPFKGLRAQRELR